MTLYLAITCVVVAIFVAACWRLLSCREVRDTELEDHSNWANGHKAKPEKETEP